MVGGAVVAAGRDGPDCSGETNLPRCPVAELLSGAGRVRRKAPPQVLIRIGRGAPPVALQSGNPGAPPRPARRAQVWSAPVRAPQRRCRILSVERREGCARERRRWVSGAAVQKFFHLRGRYLLQWIAVGTNCASPNFARACGRVSVGGHPDKRPDSRPERDRQIQDRKPGWPRSQLRTLDWQPEAKPAHPVLNGGRGLKQRRSGLFWSRRPSKGRHRRGLFTLARRAERDLPLQSKASLG
jgi:hypothetical protein